MPDPRDYQFDLSPAGRPEPFPLAERIHNRAWAAAAHCTGARPQPAREGVRAVVIHATAGGGSDGAVSVMTQGRASFHWLAPDEDEDAHGRFVWATAPEARAAWHVRNACSHPAVCGGARRVNDWSLGVEIVNAQNGADAFSSWQIEAAAAIVRYAWAKYPNLAHVVSHARLDPDRRSDPGTNFPWAEFESLVRG